MSPIICNKCQRANPAGRGFCLSCGSRLASPSEASAPPESLLQSRRPDQAKLHRSKHSPMASEGPAVELDRQLDAAEQQAIADTLRDAEQRISEEMRLRDGLAESIQIVAELRRELAAIKSQNEQQSSAERQLKESLAAGEQAIASLRRNLEAAEEKAAAEVMRETEARIAEEIRLKGHLAASSQTIAELRKQVDGAHAKAAAVAAPAGTDPKEMPAAAERTIGALKQELERVTQRATEHQQHISQKDTLIDELRRKLGDFAELEKKFQTSVSAALVGGGPAQDQAPGTANRRQFGTLAMSVIATLSAGAGGAGGYFYDRGGSKSPQPAIVSDLQNKLNASDGLNRELKDGLRSLHEAYDRIDQDLKSAQTQLAAQKTNPGAGSNDDIQRQLNEAQATNKDLHQKLAATAAELDQGKQQMAAQDQTIARLNQDLQDAKAPEAKPRETKSQDSKQQDSKQQDSKPRPRRGSDFDATIRKLEKEYGRDLGIPGYAR